MKRKWFWVTTLIVVTSLVLFLFVRWILISNTHYYMDYEVIDSDVIESNPSSENEIGWFSSLYSIIGMRCHGYSVLLNEQSIEIYEDSNIDKKLKTFDLPGEPIYYKMLRRRDKSGEHNGVVSPPYSNDLVLICENEHEKRLVIFSIVRDDEKIDEFVKDPFTFMNKYESDEIVITEETSVTDVLRGDHFSEVFESEKEWERIKKTVDVKTDIEKLLTYIDESGGAIVGLTSDGKILVKYNMSGEIQAVKNLGEEYIFADIESETYSEVIVGCNYNRVIVIDPETMEISKQCSVDEDIEKTGIKMPTEFFEAIIVGNCYYCLDYKGNLNEMKLDHSPPKKMIWRDYTLEKDNAIKHYNGKRIELDPGFEMLPFDHSEELSGFTDFEVFTRYNEAYEISYITIIGRYRDFPNKTKTYVFNIKPIPDEITEVLVHDYSSELPYYFVFKGKVGYYGCEHPELWKYCNRPTNRR
ncbi:MAG: hypothetical protein R2883_03445 [Caldisericia bacterium]